MDSGWRQHRIAGTIGAALLLVGALISVNVALQPAAEAAVDLPAGWVTDAVVSGLVEPVGPGHRTVAC